MVGAKVWLQLNWYALVLLLFTPPKPLRIGTSWLLRSTRYMLKYRRSRLLFKYWSPRKLYCSALRNGLGLKRPSSTIGRLHGMLAAAGVPQSEPKISAAVFATPVIPTLISGCEVSICVPMEFGKFCCANATSSGLSKVCTDVDEDTCERSGSTDAKKNVWFFHMGPPKVAARSCFLNGSYFWVNSVRARRFWLVKK